MFLKSSYLLFGSLFTMTVFPLLLRAADDDMTVIRQNSLLPFGDIAASDSHQNKPSSPSINYIDRDIKSPNIMVFMVQNVFSMYDNIHMQVGVDKSGIDTFTPSLRYLTQTGIVLNSFYSAPSRAAFLYGKKEDSRDQSYSSTDLLTEQLQANGYKVLGVRTNSAEIGFVSLSNFEDFAKTDVLFGTTEVKSDFNTFSTIDDDPLMNQPDFVTRNDEEFEEVAMDDGGDNLLMSLLCEADDASSNHPFFLFVSFEAKSEIKEAVDSNGVHNKKSEQKKEILELIDHKYFIYLSSRVTLQCSLCLSYSAFHYTSDHQ
mmetsp:Transcript_43230/g.55536  ORF Transcript_43230/g.55536 Transcript_43230/m.55536 type:complete len:316 (-) Transcript_43230:1030-1977(-)